jgi:hypothetical protein
MSALALAEQAAPVEQLPDDLELLNVVRDAVRSLLLSTPSYRKISPDDQRALAQAMVRIAACSAGCAREVWERSDDLGQRPVLLYREQSVPDEPVARAQTAADDFRPAAAGQAARVTEQMLRAVAFPRFVQDLIRGTFGAILGASMQEMEAYGELLENAGKTAEEFEETVITDNQARDWLQGRWPQHIRINVEDGEPRAMPAEGAEDRPVPGDLQSELSLGSTPSIDESSIEGVLVPAARRKLAATRLQMISTLVLLGINRIVVTGGKIRATMGFHIDTSDRAHVETAEDFDIRHGAQGQFGAGWWSASASMSIAYVRSTRADSDAELNMTTDLTGEVELHFKSDYFPVSRFADASGISRIQGNTAVPEANNPVEQIPWGDSKTVESRPPVQRTPRTPQIQRPAGGGLPASPVSIPPLPAISPPDQRRPGGGETTPAKQPPTPKSTTGETTTAQPPPKPPQPPATPPQPPPAPTKPPGEAVRTETPPAGRGGQGQ